MDPYGGNKSKAALACLLLHLCTDFLIFSLAAISAQWAKAWKKVQHKSRSSMPIKENSSMLFSSCYFWKTLSFCLLFWQITSKKLPIFQKNKHWMSWEIFPVIFKIVDARWSGHYRIALIFLFFNPLCPLLFSDQLRHHFTSNTTTLFQLQTFTLCRYLSKMFNQEF